MSGISPQKPVSLWQRPLKVNFGALAAALAKGTAAGVFMQWSDLASSGVDVLGSLGIQGNEVEAIAWLLVERSLLQAMVELTHECKASLNTHHPDLKILCDQLDYALKTSDLSINPDFFNRPKWLPVVEQVKEPYRLWLCSNGLSAAQAASLIERLPRYFVFALNQQWRAHPADYAPLQTSLSGPFETATEREFAWQRYGAWLQREVDKPMFAETFGLRQVYQPLRAYYKYKSQETDNVERTLPGRDKFVFQYVCDLHMAIINWLKKNDRTDTIRVICGGPGCGKSSFGRMMAAHLAESQAIPVLFVPLYQLDLSGDLLDSLNQFLRIDPDGVLPPNPLESANAELRVLLIFDGLDELEKQGKVAAQAAQDFVRETQKKLLAYNQSKARVFALLSGRDIVVQASQTEFRKLDQILHVLPYFQTEEELKQYANDDILKQDQRQDWWQTYGKLKGKDYDGLPPELDQGKLIEITAQPLLNYLVALSFDRSGTQEGIDFSAESNLNAIYNNLVDQVYQRDWADYIHPTLRDIKREDFVCILEEIAVVCWHRNGRTATVNCIADRCNGDTLKSDTLKRVLEIFKGGAAEGVTRLLTAFYFRQSGIHGSEDTFEFTHKSFGEYLTARRLMRELKLIQEKLARHRDNPDGGWDEKECLKRWVMLCGPTAMDEYLLSFLRGEVQLQPSAQVKLCQQTLCDLIGYMLLHGMPMEAIDQKRPKFIEEVRQARNASEALLAALSSCAWVTQEVSKVIWPTPEAFGTWLMTLQGQRKANEKPAALNCLNHLALIDAVLRHQNLEGAILWGSNLRGANLKGANLKGALLWETILARANLEGANLEGADLHGTNLREANLRGTNLGRANLKGADFSMANLVVGNLEEANLERANLERADLGRANLARADLRRANLGWANLRGANFVEASLFGANLGGANLGWANLEGANLEGANLEGANLEGAIR